MDHTSGGQHAAGVEMTDEQRVEWQRRLRVRADEIAHEAVQLALAAGAHRSDEGDRVAGHARTAAAALAAAASPPAPPNAPPVAPPAAQHDGGPVLLGPAPEAGDLVTGRGEQPPFAADLAVDQAPHEQ